MSSPVLCESDGKVTTITLNRPEVGNRVTNEMLGIIRQMIEDAAGTRAIVLRGTGENFCQGREIPKLAPGQVLSAIEAKQIHTEPMLKLAGAFEHVSVPIVGIVRGKVSGGGCALAGLCDVTIASDDTTFELPEMHHGIPPCLAMAVLCRRMPRKALVHLVYSTDPIDAKTALALGLISRVVPVPELEKEAAALVHKLVDYAPAAAQAVKQYMRSAPDLDTQAAAELASNLLANVVSSHR
jgi:enoyl-CoA hydratase/carnithine racemase